MASKPVADAARCDVFGCGHVASIGTTGDEVDVQGLGRKAVPNLNVCDHHANWPHSNDALVFAAGEKYRARKGA